MVDLPGQPGLSDPYRPHRAPLAWYGRVLDEVLEAMGLDSVVLVGNSLGAAVALAAGSPRIPARALISPRGFIRLTVNPRLALTSARWLLPRQLAVAVRRTMNLEVRVFAGMGHLTTLGQLDEVVSLVAEGADRGQRPSDGCIDSS